MITFNWTISAAEREVNLDGLENVGGKFTSKRQEELPSSE